MSFVFYSVDVFFVRLIGRIGGLYIFWSRGFVRFSGVCRVGRAG